ncbi:hypothetical protein BDV28DRAFT_141119 [Aspergillus coremiiformis]|uniref:Uncharacterized protein n=1 Tax=Aspergillus coremiiformis TaxID=138285 RepID=A0A5N6YVI6_9EURO|nr:hypothetical protein BDV28DRAFT_141119 [Aspergillus coremiiformis]
MGGVRNDVTCFSFFFLLVVFQGKKRWKGMRKRRKEKLRSIELLTIRLIGSSTKEERGKGKEREKREREREGGAKSKK